MECEEALGEHFIGYLRSRLTSQHGHFAFCDVSARWAMSARIAILR